MSYRIHWQIWDKNDYKKLSKAFCLPRALIQTQTAFVLIKETKQYALTKSPAALAFPAAQVHWECFYKTKLWQTILALYPMPHAQLAAYWQNVLAPHGIEPGALLGACGLADHFSKLSQWQELGRLGRMSRLLARKYDLPLRVLRLWDRFDSQEQKRWLQIWQKYSWGRNLIQDMICDYYELPATKRKASLKQAARIIAAWEKKKQEKKSRLFPQREVRDMLRKLRSPEVQKRIQEAQKEKRKLEAGWPKGLSLEPPSLEEDSLELKLVFGSLQELEDSICALQKERSRALLQELLQVLRR